VLLLLYGGVFLFDMSRHDFAVRRGFYINFMKRVAWNKGLKLAKRTTRKCEICGKQFEFKSSSKRAGRFCSNKCNGIAIKGSNLSEAHKMKIGKANTGRIRHDMRGRNHWFWNNGQRTDTRGYIHIHVDNHPNLTVDGYILLHRLIAELCLNRFLEKNEVIHHINGIVDDNRPANLYLTTHQKHNCFGKKNPPKLISNLN